MSQGWTSEFRFESAWFTILVIWEGQVAGKWDEIESLSRLQLYLSVFQLLNLSTDNLKEGFRQLKVPDHDTEYGLMGDIRLIYDLPIRETCYKVRNTTKVLNEVTFAAGIYHIPTSMITSYWVWLLFVGLPGIIEDTPNRILRDEYLYFYFHQKHIYLSILMNIDFNRNSEAGMQE